MHGKRNQATMTMIGDRFPHHCKHGLIFSIEKDYPQWEGGIPVDIADAVLKLEIEGEIEDYYDIVEHLYTHKIGGYPSFCQSGVDFGEGFEFAFQISSDEKINLNVVDNGSLMFSRNQNTGEWKLYYDFY